MEINRIDKALNKKAREGDRIGFIGEEEEFSKYAVGIPLVYINNELNVLFEVRAMNLKNQPGEISFPGGKIEKNENSLTAAVRETCEELNISPESIVNLGCLDLLITQHNKIIYPYVFRIAEVDKIQPSEKEVDHVFYVPLKFFTQNKPIEKNIKIISEPMDEFPYSSHTGAMEYKWIDGRGIIYIYKYQHYVIWGLTAKIMKHFMDVIYKSEQSTK